MRPSDYTATYEAEKTLPTRAYDLIDELDEAHPADEVCRILMTARLTAEQRLFLATKAAAKRELIVELARLKAEEIAPVATARADAHPEG